MESRVLTIHFKQKHQVILCYYKTTIILWVRRQSLELSHFLKPLPLATLRFVPALHWHKTIFSFADNSIQANLYWPLSEVPGCNYCENMDFKEHYWCMHTESRKRAIIGKHLQCEMWFPTRKSKIKGVHIFFVPSVNLFFYFHISKRGCWRVTYCFWLTEVSMQ